MMQFTKATKEQARARIALIGPSGSGKTFSALAIAAGLGSRIAVIDTERGSASKYADRFDFDTLQLEIFSPETYIEAIKAAEQAGYDVLIIDSLSHAWMGKGGALELVDRESAKMRTPNSFAAWRTVTPLHNRLVDAIISSGLHVIATMRSKMDYVQTTNDKGQTIVKKVGMQPIQRDGLEYEFDITADMDLDHNMIISKTRCGALDEKIFNKPGREFAETVKDWLTTGTIPEPRPIPHWSDTQSNRDKIAAQVARLGATIEEFFTIHGLPDWPDFRRYEGTGRDAWEYFKENWQAKKEDGAETEQATLFEAEAPATPGATHEEAS